MKKKLTPRNVQEYLVLNKDSHKEYKELSLVLARHRDNKINMIEAIEFITDIYNEKNKSTEDNI